MTDVRPAESTPTTGRRIHPAWVVAGVTFVTLVGAAAFRSVPGVLMDPLHMEFGWSHGTIGSAVAVNLMLFGLISPFAAALKKRVMALPKDSNGYALYQEVRQDVTSEAPQTPQYGVIRTAGYDEGGDFLLDLPDRATN